MMTTYAFSGHGRILCSCGALIAQCRCPDGHTNVTILERVCDSCQANEKDRRKAAFYSVGLYGDYRDFVPNYEGSVRAFWLDKVRTHPEFADELEQQRAAHELRGLSDEEIEQELGQWAVRRVGLTDFGRPPKANFDLAKEEN